MIERVVRGNCSVGFIANDMSHQQLLSQPLGLESAAVGRDEVVVSIQLTLSSESVKRERSGFEEES